MPNCAFLILIALFFSSVSSAQSLRVGTTLWPGYEPLFLAQEIKAYKEDIRILHYPSASELLQAFKNQTLEAAALTLDEIISLAESGIEVDIILVLDISEGADVIMAKPEIKNMKGLIGARVAVESTAVGAYTLTRALEVHGIDIRKIRLINVEDSSHKETYKSNNADAVVTYEPFRTQLLKEGAIEIFNSSEIPGEIIDVLAVHKGIIQSHSDELLDVSQGWFKALKYIKDEPVSSYKFIASRMKVSTREVKESYFGLSLPDLKKNRVLLSGTPAPLIETFKHLAQHMKNNNLISSSFSSLTTVNNKFLPQSK